MSKNQQFQKFITYKSNAAKKEQFKQEKRSVKKERAAAIEKRFEEKRQAKSGVISREAADSLKNKVVRTEPKPVQPAAKTQQITQPGAQNKPAEKKTTRGPKPGSLE